MIGEVMIIHKSDCAVHNMPAYPGEPCDREAMSDQDFIDELTAATEWCFDCYEAGYRDYIDAPCDHHTSIGRVPHRLAQTVLEVVTSPCIWQGETHPPTEGMNCGHCGILLTRPVKEAEHYRILKNFRAMGIGAKAGVLVNIWTQLGFVAGFTSDCVFFRHNGEYKVTLKDVPNPDEAAEQAFLDMVREK